MGEALEQHGHEVQYFGMEHEGRCVGNRVNAYCPMEDLEYLEFKVAVLDGDSYDEICISDPVTISFE